MSGATFTCWLSYAEIRAQGFTAFTLMEGVRSSRGPQPGLRGRVHRRRAPHGRRLRRAEADRPPPLCQSSTTPGNAALELVSRIRWSRALRAPMCFLRPARRAGDELPSGRGRVSTSTLRVIVPREVLIAIGSVAMDLRSDSRLNHRSLLRPARPDG